MTQGAWQNTLNNIGAVELVHQEFADQAEQAEPDAHTPAAALSQGIALETVSFAYNKAVGDVIDQVSLTRPARTSVAFVGESGAGKSTLVDLLSA